MHGAILPLPLYAFILLYLVRNRRNFTFTFTTEHFVIIKQCHSHLTNFPGHNVGITDDRRTEIAKIV
jgi:hypothetical protein